MKKTDLRVIMRKIYREWSDDTKTIIIMEHGQEILVRVGVNLTTEVSK